MESGEPSKRGLGPDSSKKSEGASNQSVLLRNWPDIKNKIEKHPERKDEDEGFQLPGKN